MHICTLRCVKLRMQGPGSWLVTCVLIHLKSAGKKVTTLLRFTSNSHELNFYRKFWNDEMEGFFFHPDHLSICRNKTYWDQEENKGFCGDGWHQCLGNWPGFCAPDNDEKGNTQYKEISWIVSFIEYRLRRQSQFKFNLWISALGEKNLPDYHCPDVTHKYKPGEECDEKQSKHFGCLFECKDNITRWGYYLYWSFLAFGWMAEWQLRTIWVVSGSQSSKFVMEYLNVRTKMTRRRICALTVRGKGCYHYGKRVARIYGISQVIPPRARALINTLYCQGVRLPEKNRGSAGQARSVAGHLPLQAPLHGQAHLRRPLRRRRRPLRGIHGRTVSSESNHWHSHATYRYCS